MKYRMLVPTVDVLFLDVAQPDRTCIATPSPVCEKLLMRIIAESRIAALNARLFLKQGGGLIISIKYVYLWTSQTIPFTEWSEPRKD